MRNDTLRAQRFYCMLAALTATLASGCAGDEAPKAWNGLATCLAGETAGAAVPERIKRLRLAQLGAEAAPGVKDAWPSRCMSFANQLHAVLPTSGKQSMLRRKLAEKLGCEDEKKTCNLNNDDALIPTATMLWEAARDSELLAQASADAPKPPSAPELPITQQTWKSLSDQPKSTDGPWLTPDGRALLLLKDTQGKGKPTGCELPPGFTKLSCTAANPSVPDLPLQTVRLVAEPSSIYAAALLESGLTAFDLKTGKTTGVRGSRQLVINGVAVEESAPPAEDPAKASASKGKPDAAGGTPGLVAVVMKDGKPGKELKLATDTPIIKPVALHDHVVWVEGGQDTNRLVIEAVKGGQLRRVADHKGTFKGALHTCDAEGTVGVAIWDKRADLLNAKPTRGADETELTVTVLKGGNWSKPVTAALPFKRAAESELVCTKGGVSVTWAKVERPATPTGASQVELGRVDCNADACKASSAKLPGVDSKWWWSITPMGDNVLMLWRGGLGETRLRLAPIAGLAAAQDKILFDSSDYGGPTPKDVNMTVSSDGALLLFRDERPVAVRVGKDGSFGVLTP